VRASSSYLGRTSSSGSGSGAAQAHSPPQQQQQQQQQQQRAVQFQRYAEQMEFDARAATAAGRRLSSSGGGSIPAALGDATQQQQASLLLLPRRGSAGGGSSDSSSSSVESFTEEQLLEAQGGWEFVRPSESQASYSTLMSGAPAHSAAAASAAAAGAAGDGSAVGFLTAAAGAAAADEAGDSEGGEPQQQARLQDVPLRGSNRPRSQASRSATTATHAAAPAAGASTNTSKRRTPPQRSATAGAGAGASASVGAAAGVMGRAGLLLRFFTADRLSAGLPSGQRVCVEVVGASGAVLAAELPRCVSRLGRACASAHAHRVAAACGCLLPDRPCPAHTSNRHHDHLPASCHNSVKGAFARGGCDAFALHSAAGDVGPIAAVRVWHEPPGAALMGGGWCLAAVEVEAVLRGESRAVFYCCVAQHTLPSHRHDLTHTHTHTRAHAGTTYAFANAAGEGWLARGRQRGVTLTRPTVTRRKADRDALAAEAHELQV
jgi:hypothetical protein